MAYTYYDDFEDKKNVITSGRTESGASITDIQFIRAGGKSVNAKIVSGGIQRIESGGNATGATVAATGSQHVSLGGLAIKTKVESGGAMTVESGGTVKDAIIQCAGRQYIDGVASNTVVYGSEYIGTSYGLDSNYKQTSTTLLYTNYGTQYLTKGGASFKTSLKGGIQKVSDRGIATSTQVSSGGKQWILDGTAKDTKIFSGGGQFVKSGGRAINTSIKGGWQRVEDGAIAYSTTIIDGWQYVDGGVARTTTVDADGILQVMLGGSAYDTTVNSGGLLELFAGAGASSVVLKSGAEMSIANKNVIDGFNNFDGAIVSGGKASRPVKLGMAAKLTVGTQTDMSSLHLKVDSATITFRGEKNTLGSLKLGSKSQIAYNISNLKAKESAPMVSLLAKNSQKKGAFSISVAYTQVAGTYKLSKNLIQKNGTAYTVNILAPVWKQNGPGRTLSTEPKKLGVAKLNSSALTKNGATYSVKMSGTQINLVVAMNAGKTLKGTAKANSLTGTANCDVFYGGKGNDTIKGVNGRDVAVYDKTAWGKDKILATEGSMTLLFKDLKESDLVTAWDGQNLTVTRKGATGQSITIQGWNGGITHNIVFGSTMTAVDKWLKASKPTAAQTNAARNEVWKKAGLAQA